MHALDIIQGEHRSLLRIADSMDAVADAIEAGTPVEDGFFTALFEYAHEFMGGCHHAKEDEYLFAAMRARVPEKMELLSRQMEHEHVLGVERLKTLQQLHHALTSPSETTKPADPQTAFLSALRNYTVMLRKHLLVEDEELLPLAREALLPEDWAAINAAFENNDAPLFEAQATARYDQLYHMITSVAPEPVDLGASRIGEFSPARELPRSKTPLLEVRDLESCYGRIKALNGLNILVHEGELVALIGANGAGKTTFLRTLSGVQPLAGGSIRFAGQDISRLRADRRVRAGICHSPEGRQVFGPLTIEDNLRLGAYALPGKTNASELERVYEMFPILHEKRHLSAGTLSGGQQQMLAIGRALMGSPRLLLLDEPSMGLAPLLVEEVFNVIRTLRQQGMTILLVEQNAFAALGIADRAYVLETGHIVLSGTGQALREDETVRAAYLGV